ncbi:MAG: peptide ABC transporter substrate-binding protein [Sphaerochaeta sp.]|nr:peptide ABC transporter substrate-binding protein [Sphaerochaeta sp.]
MNYRKGVLVAVALLMALLPLFAKGQKEMVKQEVELVYNAIAECNGYDPMDSSGLDQRTLIQACFEGLLKVSPETGEYGPGQAERYEVLDNGLRYRFYLRNDIKWQDGKAVVAGDFEYAMKRQLDPAFASSTANNLYFIKNAAEIHRGEMDADALGVTAVSDTVLDVIIKTANPFILEWFAHASTYPVRADVAEANIEGWTLDPKTYIGNGPFKMVSWVSRDSIKMVKSETYYDKAKVKLDKLTYVFIPEQTTALAALRTGEIDVTEQVPSAEVPNLIADGTAVTTPMGATYFYSINMNPQMQDPAKMAPIWDKRVRHALSLAIDRVAITENLLKGGQVPAYGFIPEGIIGADGKDFRKSKKYFDPKGDVAQAQKLMAEAGFAGGKGFPVYEIFYNTNDMHATIAQAVQDMWKKNLGINVKLVNKETTVFADERAQGKHEIARCGNLCSTAYPEILGLFVPENMLTLNDPKWVDDEYVSLIRRAKDGTDAQEIFELYHQAEDILMDEMVVIPIFFYSRVLAKAQDIDGIYVKGNLFFDRAYRK